MHEEKFPHIYLTIEQLCKKYKFMTKNSMKNFLNTNPRDFKERCIRKLGRKNLVIEEEFLKYIEENK